MFAVIFPGQGSQKSGMGKELYDNELVARSVFERVQKAIEIDVAALCFDTPDDVLRQTENAQLALFTCGLAAWMSLGEKMDGDCPGVFAGHSVGEYAAVVASGALSLEDGAKLVRLRGELMAHSGQSRPGTMAAVLGLDREMLEEVCNKASAGGTVVIANDNCPGQLVISGDTSSVQRAAELATARGAKRVLPLSVSGAFHSPLMEAPAEEMGRALSGVEFNQPAGSLVYSNVTTEPVRNPAEWPELLKQQLRSPVLWTGSIMNMIRDGIDLFIECGSGEVLTGLIRRIDKQARTAQVNDISSLNKALSVIKEAQPV